MQNIKNNEKIIKILKEIEEKAGGSVYEVQSIKQQREKLMIENKKIKNKIELNKITNMIKEEQKKLEKCQKTTGIANDLIQKEQDKIKEINLKITSTKKFDEIIDLNSKREKLIKNQKTYIEKFNSLFSEFKNLKNDIDVLIDKRESLQAEFADLEEENRIENKDIEDKSDKFSSRESDTSSEENDIVNNNIDKESNDIIGDNNLNENQDSDQA